MSRKSIKLKNSKTNLASKKFTHKCKLMDLPAENYIGGQVRRGQKSVFPILKGMAIFSLILEKGGLRIPHWHPNADELDYCIEGKARMTIVSPDAHKETIMLEAGDIAFIPRGYFHYIENIGEGTLKFLVIFDNEMPDDIGITDALAGIPDDILATAFHVSSTTFKNFEKGDDLVTSKKVSKGLKNKPKK
jgi:oxalate decarboxylase